MFPASLLVMPEICFVVISVHFVAEAVVCGVVMVVAVAVAAPVVPVMVVKAAENGGSTQAKDE